MFRKVLVANRGEIAARIVRTLRRLQIPSVAVYSDADRFTLPARLADEAIRLGPPPAAESYLNVEAILAACRRTGAEAVHPGYGFLAENAEFAERLAAAGVAFIGPRPEHIRAFGLKHSARTLAAQAGVPLLPGSGLLKDLPAAFAAAEQIGYPAMLKSTAGGGGIGMQLCAGPDELAARFEAAGRLAAAHFGDGRLYLERFVAAARHIEVQIFGDGKGGVLALGDRDCSLQRRNQKVVEEAPAPGLSAATRRALHDAAVALGRAVAYESAGTVEFVYDVAREQAYFLEVNTRLQVEHPVTEAVYGVDLVEWMVRLAAGELTLPADGLQPQGCAFEARLYAEDPARDFRPQTGLLTHVSLPADVRVDGWIETGVEVTAHYDPLLAKLIVHAPDRADALDRLARALDATEIWGLETNCGLLAAIAADPAVRAGEATTATLKAVDYRPAAVEVVAPGAQSSLQDWPGRLGYWEVGVPPSGPMDGRSHRLVNCILGNPESAATLECTLSGPTLRFRCDTTFALGGAVMEAHLDDAAVPYWRPVAARAGQTLTLGRVKGPGQRTYLAVRSGFDAPLYLGSRATFALGGFGGHATGALRAGDMLRLARQETEPWHYSELPAELLPELTDDWEIGVVYGPHGAPDFFTEADIEDLFSRVYEVHFNSARSGVRLIGPRPRWARSDGGEAGLHPSNIHDAAYAIGSIDFTGDMPIVLGPDGPSLGGFVCPAVVAPEELWKLGQLKPGDKVRFRPLERGGDPAAGPQLGTWGSAILAQSADGRTPVAYRRAGDDNLLVEYGPMTLDLALRLRVHLLARAVRATRLRGVIDLTPGARSLQIHYDSLQLPRSVLLDALVEIERALPDAAGTEVPSRIVHLPLSWNDASVRLAMRKYQELVRPDAPWCPSNIEFIQRINGLASEDEVRRIVFDARYLVLGLGDVYLGAPLATPLDPRHRLVTTKYNPARTWTPENAVGIGGAYLCVYGMEGPGGYQLFGRTVQMWNSWRATDAFASGKPWLLRFFDQIRFFPVSEAELAEAREAFPHGGYPLRIEETRFSYAEHARYLAENAAEIAAFKAGQQSAFDAERAEWRRRGVDGFAADEAAPQAMPDGELPEGCVAVHAEVGGSVWRVLAAAGELVASGQPIAMLESMKMEMPVAAPMAGRVRELRCAPGQIVRPGQIMALLQRA